MEIAHNSPIIGNKRKIFPSLYASPIEIPENSSEILLSSLKNLDIGKLVKKDLKKKIMQNETNDFHFYDIPMYFQKEETKKVINPFPNYKSIHNSADLLQAKSFGSKIFGKPEYDILETKARNSLKRTGSLLMLNEMFFELETDKKLEKKPKEKEKEKSEEDPPILHAVTEGDYERDREKNVVSNLDTWIKKALKYQEIRHQKGYLPNIHARKETNDSEKEKKELLEEEILKKYNNEDYQNLKVKVRKKEDYEIQSFLKKMPKINKISTVFFENQDKKIEETNENFILSVKKNVKAILRADFSKSTILEMADFLEKHVDLLLGKIEHKIKNWEALLVTKERTMQLIRKENNHILERIHKLKELKSTLMKKMDSKATSPMRKSIASKKTSEKGNMKKSENASPMAKSILEFSFLHTQEEGKKNLEEVQENITSYENQLEYNNKMIQDLEPSKKSVKDDVKHLIKIHKKFLLKLLKFGKDFRKEGLGWLIKRCWNLGETINEHALPDFLDVKAKEFLLMKAKHQENIKEYELFSKISVEILKTNILDSNVNKSIIKEIDEAKTDYIQEKMVELEMSSGSLFLTKPPNLKEGVDSEEKQLDILESSKLILRNEITIFKDKIKEMVYKRFKDSMDPMTKHSISDVVYEETRKRIKELIRPKYDENSLEKTHFDELSSLTFDVNYSDNFTQNVFLYENNKKCLYHNNRNDFLKDVENLAKKITETQKIIRKCEQNEICRIVKEFDYKHYAKRFNVDVTTVLSSLIGVKHALKEISKFGMGGKA